MNYQLFSQYFSAPRIGRYLQAADYSAEKAMRLYKTNLIISQAFHPLLGMVEVILRNTINDVLSEYFQDSNWIINQKAGFMTHSSLNYTYKKTGQLRTNDFLKNEVVNAEKRLKKNGTKITSSKVIAEQSFGFWTDLFEVHHYRLLKGKPIQVFQNLPSGYGRKEISERLNSIRRFRNRINHNEPICFKGEVLDYANAVQVHSFIIEIFNFINPAIIVFVSELDTVKAAIYEAELI